MIEKHRHFPRAVCQRVFVCAGQDDVTVRIDVAKHGGVTSKMPWLPSPVNLISVSSKDRVFRITVMMAP
jgi:hypothetical protein